MNELGIIINQNGEYLSFGDWIERKDKDTKNPRHWHDDSFMIDVYPTLWFKNLNIPFTDTDTVTSKLDLLAQSGIITIINIKNNIDDIDAPALQIASPENITEEQYNTIFDLKEKLIMWSENNTSFIDIIDVNGEYTEDNFGNINEYYEYLENKKSKLR